MTLDQADEYLIALRVARILEDLGIEYALGGSLATSLQGEPRSTNDIDFAVRLSEADVAKLATALGPDFSIDEESGSSRGSEWAARHRIVSGETFLGSCAQRTESSTPNIYQAGPNRSACLTCGTEHLSSRDKDETPCLFP
jgi:hypothetical protein